MKTDVLCMGEAVVDFLTDETDKGIAGSASYTRAAGGAPANVAVGLARLGLVSAFLGKVGGDQFGDFLASSLSSYGVNTANLIRDPEYLTTLFFIAGRSDGKKDMLCYRSPGADIMIRPDEVSEDAVKNARVFHFGSLSLSRFPSRDAVYTALGYARHHGVFVTFDPNYRATAWDNPLIARGEVLGAMQYADLVKISDEEWQTLMGDASFEEGTGRMMEMGVSLAAVTMGEKGTYYRTANSSGTVKTPQVAYLDSLGAGDSFMSGLIYSLLSRGMIDGKHLLHDKPPAPSIAFANTAGALAVTKRGAMPALPGLNEIAELLGKYGTEGAKLC
ncbi:MAG: hypothetical protein A2Y33_03955 [Spirochaetes bacterium GWF1_51_8]|nr:MAG: hypothetical protein A2Y33_03955 [Spirochaetes bacterium GWF1_51_8]